MHHTCLQADCPRQTVVVLVHPSCSDYYFDSTTDGFLLRNPVPVWFRLTEMTRSIDDQSAAAAAAASCFSLNFWDLLAANY